MKEIKNITFNKMVLEFKNIKKSKKNEQGKSMYDGEVFINNKKVHRQIYYVKDLFELMKMLNNSYKINIEHQ